MKKPTTLRLERNTEFTEIFLCMTSDYIILMVYQQLDDSCLSKIHYHHFLATDGYHPHFIIKANVKQIRKSVLNQAKVEGKIKV